MRVKAGLAGCSNLLHVALLNFSQLIDRQRPPTPARVMLLLAHEREVRMLYYALMFLVVGLIAGVLGVTGVASIASQIAWILFVIGIILLVVHVITGRRGSVV
jgi:uncharacterized membrane protein YtjA (UPF0391 family)